MPAGGTHGGGRGRVRAVGVEHHRDAQAELREHVLPHFREHSFAGGHVGAADEDRRAVQILRPAREDAAVDQRHHVLRRDAAVAEHVLRAGVDGHDAIEHARQRDRCRAG